MCAEWDICSLPPILELDCDLAQIVDVGTGSETADVPFRVTNPSVKLHLTLEIFVKPGVQGGGVGPTPHDYTGETWQLYATAVVSQTGDIFLNPVFYNASFPPVATPRPLPDTYEVESGVRVVNGLAHITPGLEGVNQVGERYMVRARWEPRESCMTTEERRYWFSFCAIKGPDIPVQVSATEGP